MSDKERVKALLEVRKTISKTLLNLRYDLEAVRSAELLSVSQILTCAENIQVSLKAPKDWKIGLPLYFSHPPSASTEEMRRGKLAEFNRRENQMRVSLIEDQTILNNIQKYIHVSKSTTSLSKRKRDSVESSESKASRTRRTNLTQESVESFSDSQQSEDVKAEMEALEMRAHRERVRAEEEDLARLENDASAQVAAARPSRSLLINFGFSDSEDDEQ